MRWLIDITQVIGGLVYKFTVDDNSQLLYCRTDALDAHGLEPTFVWVERKADAGSCARI